MDSGRPQKPCIHRRQRRRGYRGRDPPQYLTRRGLWRHGFASLYRSFGTNWYFYKVYHTTIQSMGHMNLKNNTPRMHHITPFWDEKFVNFLKGSPDPTPSPPTAPRFSRLRRSTCDPQCSSGVDAHACISQAWPVSSQKKGGNFGAF